MNVRKPIDYSTMFQSIVERRIYNYFTQEDAITLMTCGNAKLILHNVLLLSDCGTIFDPIILYKSCCLCGSELDPLTISASIFVVALLHDAVQHNANCCAKEMCAYCKHEAGERYSVRPQTGKGNV